MANKYPNIDDQIPSDTLRRIRRDEEQRYFDQYSYLETSRFFHIIGWIRRLWLQG